MTTVSGCAAGSTPSRSSADSAATWPATKVSDSVRLMKPGPLTSTSAQMSSSDGRRHDLLGHLARRAADDLGQGQGAVGLEVGPVRRPQHRVGAREHGVEGGLEPLEEDAGGVGHPSFSHARPGANPATRRQSAGAPMPPSSNP